MGLVGRLLKGRHLPVMSRPLRLRRLRRQTRRQAYPGDESADDGTDANVLHVSEHCRGERPARAGSVLAVG